MNFMNKLLTIILLLFLQNLIAQNITLKGKVTDAESGEPLAFVNIGVVESGNGTTSDENGQFTLDLNFDNDSSKFTLKFNYFCRGARNI